MTTNFFFKLTFKLLLTACLAFSFLISTPALAKKTKPIITVDEKNAYQKTFIKAKSCSPVLAWQNWQYDDDKANLPVSAWDIVLYDYIKGSFTQPGGLGEKIFQQDNLSESRFKIPKELKPKTVYFWSFRPRYSNGTTGSWATQNSKRGSWTIGTEVSYSNFPFGFKTPSNCP